MSMYTTVVLYSAGTGPVKTFMVPTEQINPKDLEDIRAAAAKVHMAVFVSTQGWQGIEALKWDIERINDTTLD